MFTIPEAFAAAHYFLGYDRPLWYIAMFVTYISGIVFLVRERGAEAKVSKQWYLAFTLFSFCYATTRLLFNLAVEFGMNTPTSYEYDFWCSLGYISAITGALFLIYVAEKNIITSTRKIGTIILVIGLIASVLGVAGVYDRSISLVITYGASLIATILILFIYIAMIRNSTGSLRKKTLGAFIGIIIWFVAIILDGQVAYTAITGMPTLLPPIMYLVGVVLYTFFQRAG